MKSEADFKRQLMDQCRAKGAYAIRHEDRYGLGRLDLSIKFPGLVEIRAEAKLVPHQSFAPTLRQFEEGKKYQAAGGLPVLIGFDPKTKQMYIHEWVATATKAGSFTGEGNYAEQLTAWLMARRGFNESGLK